VGGTPKSNLREKELKKNLGRKKKTVAQYVRKSGRGGIGGRSRFDYQGLDVCS